MKNKLQFVFILCIGLLCLLKGTGTISSRRMQTFSQKKETPQNLWRLAISPPSFVHTEPSNTKPNQCVNSDSTHVLLIQKRRDFTHHDMEICGISISQHLADAFCTLRYTTLMAVALVLGFIILPKDTSTCRPGESNQRPSSNKARALTLSHSRPRNTKDSEIWKITIPPVSTDCL